MGQYDKSTLQNYETDRNAQSQAWRVFPLDEFGVRSRLGA
jgi:hypothetical protein